MPAFSAACTHSTVPTPKYRGDLSCNLGWIEKRRGRLSGSWDSWSLGWVENNRLHEDDIFFFLLTSSHVFYFHYCTITAVSSLGCVSLCCSYPVRWRFVWFPLLISVICFWLRFTVCYYIIIYISPAWRIGMKWVFYWWRWVGRTDMWRQHKKTANNAHNTYVSQSHDTSTCVSGIASQYWTSRAYDTISHVHVLKLCARTCASTKD